ncbi:hypothetical protein P3X46_017826 [Hevea brasiliensis]|uniref:Uncharacterized protein n=1 Tax=Hevea brasiliensis TaxID=3981 RepID=A0ABQ9LNV6_HEVBR|nr:uncharacterized protein LOC110649575 [Hevea brasiliensis]XP_021659878.2 uncharacterized protein LOC110649575 [Hevea brasiliensis]XP_057985031.1 uncharacterized protein LOC110649575 [Hevea brasiliensis]KAJ9169664.1 hypothetical protein P3X46_017826 [Hevea brasiliensis]
MVWNYPGISLEEMVKLIKGFVDILILASGYQSSGLLAQWDAHNIKKAFHWASFFENVLRQISSSDAYQDSVKELDVAIREMTSNPSFPPGLANLSYGTLNRARNFVLAHLFHTLPLRDSHLRAFLTAIIEMDLDKHSGSEHECLSVYLNKFNLVPERIGLVKDSVIAVEDITPTMKLGRFTDDDLTKFTLQELFKRQSAVSCISKVGTGLDILSKAIRCCSWTDSDSSLSEEHLKHEGAQTSVGSADQLVDFITWHRWKSLNLSYFLHKRTVRLVSGASMIFSAPKFKWLQIFEWLNTSAKCKEDDDLQETIELMLLGCITNKWNHLIEYFMSVSYDPFTISKLYHEVCSLFTGRSQSSHSKEESTDSKENAILEYLDRLLGGQLHQLWKLSPVLVAVAIPFWSPLFRLYLSEIESQFKGDSSVMRCCSCVLDRKEHEDCQLAERIWCLHIFHICGFHVMYGANSA